MRRLDYTPQIFVVSQSQDYILSSIVIERNPTPCGRNTHPISMTLDLAV